MGSSYGRQLFRRNFCLVPTYSPLVAGPLLCSVPEWRQTSVDGWGWANLSTKCVVAYWSLERAFRPFPGRLLQNTPNWPLLGSTRESHRRNTNKGSVNPRWFFLNPSHRFSRCRFGPKKRHMAESTFDPSSCVTYTVCVSIWVRQGLSVRGHCSRKAHSLPGSPSSSPTLRAVVTAKAEPDVDPYNHRPIARPNRECRCWGNQWKLASPEIT